jgi:hypothetical protein
MKIERKIANHPIAENFPSELTLYPLGKYHKQLLPRNYT